jgi:hypothetical protein
MRSSTVFPVTVTVVVAARRRTDFCTRSVLVERCAHFDFDSTLSLADIEAKVADPHGSIVFWFRTRLARRGHTSIAAETTGSRQ